jgi:hypothetical protein
MEGEKMESHKKGFLKLKYFPPLKILTSPLSGETLGAFFCSVSCGLRGFDDIGGENHFFNSFFSIDLTWNDMVMTVDIPAVDAYSGMVLCTPNG